ncbi:hypothetical protein F2Q65_02780 [Thiohalocapsa marina]|uniref:Uncharacterized protein n=1 Tax=Thiohalocapsa marina TaxID=424902 RepID=A0A5M8FUP5_9GAMM|nr:hypothetical protein [Thiohalocapsa marina]KAA6187459.1 hypothetical protein F2Q65_02780 [Thiohalocapsa marina]
MVPAADVLAPAEGFGFGFGLPAAGVGRLAVESAAVFSAAAPVVDAGLSGADAADRVPLMVR